MHRESKNAAVIRAYEQHSYTDHKGTTWRHGMQGWYGRLPGEAENTLLDHRLMIALITHENPPERWEIYNTDNLLPVGLGSFHSEEAAQATIERFRARDEKAGRPAKSLAARPVIRFHEEMPEPKAKPVKSSRRPGYSTLSV
jgi:hypothetical protein